MLIKGEEMRTTLISLLGNSRQSGDYRRVRYRYQGETLAPVTYIGYALRKVLQPERFVILGTTGSMWDHLFESDLELEGQHEEERSEERRVGKECRAGRGRSQCKEEDERT